MYCFQGGRGGGEGCGVLKMPFDPFFQEKKRWKSYSRWEFCDHLKYIKPLKTKKNPHDRFSPSCEFEAKYLREFLA